MSLHCDANKINYCRLINNTIKPHNLYGVVGFHAKVIQRIYFVMCACECVKSLALQIYHRKISFSNWCARFNWMKCVRSWTWTWPNIQNVYIQRHNSFIYWLFAFHSENRSESIITLQTSTHAWFYWMLTINFNFNLNLICRNGNGSEYRCAITTEFRIRSSS